MAAMVSFAFVRPDDCCIEGAGVILAGPASA